MYAHSTALEDIAEKYTREDDPRYVAQVVSGLTCLVCLQLVSPDRGHSGVSILTISLHTGYDEDTTLWKSYMQNVLCVQHDTNGCGLA